jgi:hypothetical protein
MHRTSDFLLAESVAQNQGYKYENKMWYLLVSVHVVICPSNGSQLDCPAGRSTLALGL